MRAPLPCGRPHQGGIGLPDHTQQAIRARLAQPQGERSYLALWRWARAEHAVAYSYAHFHRWVHDQLGATLKVARKSHGKKEAQLVAFREGGLSEKLAAVQASHPGQRVRLWSQDENRFGLQTIQRRRLTLLGVKPVCSFEQAFENFWLCGAVGPNTGEGFVLELPATDGDCLQVFLDQFAAAHAQDPAEVPVLLMDNGGAHRAKALRWPARVVPAYLPAYCPELNPIERWWQELKDENGYQGADVLNIAKSLPSQQWSYDATRDYFVHTHSGCYVRIMVRVDTRNHSSCIVTSYLNPALGDRNLEAVADAKYRDYR